MKKIKASTEHLIVGRWFYNKPSIEPNDEGDITIIQKLSPGPCEVFEWGIKEDHSFYEMYEWCEDDWFEDTSYIRPISKAELIKQIDVLMELVKAAELSDWMEDLNKILAIIKEM